ncbi:hypothetical protein GZH82_12365 [Staphylococcus ursi]|uniref:hypothetical protein n=1 Tax=Staphylococcus sp. MI 10-1553 TaxID=1912064 RepID=UPI001398C5FB|nr:hypothetical protein [Staphylococcus sp. MI 10-1553]QHW38074.1 hypothetical protein GZH82_12365 [Staphylococcus sp. MI 10-1553]
MNANKVKIRFKDDGKQTLKNVVRVETDINYSMYQCTHKDGAQTFIKGKDIKIISFGKSVDIEEY